LARDSGFRGNAHLHIISELVSLLSQVYNNILYHHCKRSRTFFCLIPRLQYHRLSNREDGIVILPRLRSRSALNLLTSDTLVLTPAHHNLTNTISPFQHIPTCSTSCSYVLSKKWRLHLLRHQISSFKNSAKPSSSTLLQPQPQQTLQTQPQLSFANGWASLPNPGLSTQPTINTTPCFPTHES